METGTTPINFTLARYNGGNETLDSHSGKVILLSFIDIINSWDWLNHLKNIQDDPAIAGISGDVQIIAVVYNYLDAGSETVLGIPYTGSINDTWIQDKITETGITGISFPILVNGAWVGSPASQYRSGFPNDPLFAGGPNNYFFTYIISKDHVITDKWNSNSTSNGNPISFNRISLTATPAFNSAPANWATTEDYVVERIKNLNNPPKILSVTPTHGTTLNSVSSMEIVVSKLLNETEANTAANYVLSGGGVDSLAVDTSIPGGFTEVQYFRGADRVENVISLPFTGSVTDVNPDDSVTMTIQLGLQDTEAQSFSTTLATDNTVTYTADITGHTPSFAFTSPTNADPFTVRVDFGTPVDLSDAGVFPAGSISVDVFSITDQTPVGGAAPRQQWDIEITPPAGSHDTNCTLTVAANLYPDSLGNLNEENDCTIHFDNIQPLPTINNLPGSAVSGVFTVRIDFTEPVTDSAVVTDISVINGAASNPSEDTVTVTDHSRWYVDITPDGGGDVTIQYPAGTAGPPSTGYQDAAGNWNALSSSHVIPYTPPAVDTYRDIMLVLDLSDSMNWPVTCDGGIQQPKIEYIKPEIAKFKDLLLYSGMTDLANDRISIVSFNNIAQNIQIDGDNQKTFDGSIIDPSTEDDHIQAIINALSCGGGTAMGQGLTLAFNQLSYTQDDAAYARERAIVLYADGQDNRTPLVTADGASIQIPAPSNINVGPGTTNNHIPVHTIGIHTETMGDTSSWLTKLGNIASATDGINHGSPGNHIWPTTEYDFDDIFTAIYGPKCPQVIHQGTGSLSTQTPLVIEDFFLNTELTQLMVRVSWPGTKPLEMKLKKGSLTIQFDKIIRRDQYVMGVLSLPHNHTVWDFSITDHVFNGGLYNEVVPTKYKRKNSALLLENYDTRKRKKLQNYITRKIHSEGEWSVEINALDNTNPEGALYSVSIMADDENLKIQPKKPNRNHSTGKALDFLVYMEENKRPFNGSSNSFVKITKPKYSVANLIEQYSDALKKIDITSEINRRIESSPQLMKMKITTEKIIQEMSEYEKKVLALQQIPKAAAALREVEIGTITLRHRMFKKGKFSLIRDKGHIRGRYNRVLVPGTYKLEYYINGNAPATGPFMRKFTRTINVLPAVDLSSSILDKKIDKVKGTITLTVKPQDRFGNYLGQGYAEYVKTNTGEKTVLQVIDKKDGTYTVEIPLPKKTNHPLKVRIGRSSVFKMKE